MNVLDLSRASMALAAASTSPADLKAAYLAEARVVITSVEAEIKSLRLLLNAEERELVRLSRKP